jgi:hypothetical protein
MVALDQWDEQDSEAAGGQGQQRHTSSPQRLALLARMCRLEVGSLALDLPLAAVLPRSGRAIVPMPERVAPNGCQDPVKLRRGVALRGGGSRVSSPYRFVRSHSQASGGRPFKVEPARCWPAGHGGGARAPRCDRLDRADRHEGDVPPVTNRRALPSDAGKRFEDFAGRTSGLEPFQ